MKQWRDRITGIRLFDDEGDYLVNYSINEIEGDWSDAKQIPHGQSIIGLMVHEL